MAELDKSNGYEEIAAAFIAGRGRSTRGIGASVVADWSRMPPDRASILDLGCGTGVPISQALIERGFSLWGVGASASMIVAFRQRFPEVPLECAAVEDSRFFNRVFDGVIAWGLFFLLSENVQRKLITKIATVLPRRGRLLFTAPSTICRWSDAMTGPTLVSLGYRAYRKAIEADGMSLVGACRDEGGSHYYDVQKT